MNDLGESDFMTEVILSIMVFEATGFDPYFPSWICLSILTMGFPGDSDSRESACSVGDLGLIPRLGRSPGEGNGNPLHDSSLENPIDRGAWQSTVHGVTESYMTEQLALSLSTVS